MNLRKDFFAEQARSGSSADWPTREEKLKAVIEEKRNALDEAKKDLAARQANYNGRISRAAPALRPGISKVGRPTRAENAAGIATVGQSIFHNADDRSVDGVVLDLQADQIG